MSQVVQHETQFTDLEAPLIAEYQAVNRWALLALGALLVSPAALLTPLLWFLPLVAAAFATVALVRVARGEGRVAGGRLATVSLALSLFLLGLAPAAFFVYRAAACRQARAYADDWLELLREGRRLEAHQLHLMYHSRVPPRTDLEKHYTPRFPEGGGMMRDMMQLEDPYAELERFWKEEPLPELLAAGEKLEFDYRRTVVSPKPAPKGAMLVQVFYTAKLPADGGPRLIPIVVEMERVTNIQTKQSHWRVRWLRHEHQAGAA